MADETTKSVTWKATAIGAAMTVATSAGGYISTHWGGVTSEQLQQTEQRLGAKISGVELKVAKSSDDLKEYVDEKIESAEDRLSPKLKKRKERREP